MEAPPHWCWLKGTTTLLPSSEQLQEIIPNKGFCNCLHTCRAVEFSQLAMDCLLTMHTRKQLWGGKYEINFSFDSCATNRSHCVWIFWVLSELWKCQQQTCIIKKIYIQYKSQDWPWFSLRCKQIIRSKTFWFSNYMKNRLIWTKIEILSCCVEINNSNFDINNMWNWEQVDLHWCLAFFYILTNM